jgi:hypothetical protein
MSSHSHTTAKSQDVPVTESPDATGTPTAVKAGSGQRSKRSRRDKGLPHKIFRFLSSLKLTVIFLGLATILVFVATLDQVNLGIHFVQEKYFQSWIVWWDLPGTDFALPIMPGGYFIGWVLVLNLLCAHAVRFRMTWKKSGIFLVHVGLLILLLGQFFTGILQEERQMRLDEGETSNYSEDMRSVELAIMDVSDPDHNKVVAIPQEILNETPTIQHPELPFTVNVEEFYSNSRVAMVDQTDQTNPVEVNRGIGTTFVAQKTPRAVKMNERDLPTAFVTLQSPEGEELGTWMLSNLFEEVDAPVFNQPQNLTFNDRTYRLVLRQARDYKPFALTLMDFRHERYPGTDIPKDFSSHVQLVDDTTNTDRDVRIYMNNPLRYGGYTFFQASFANNDTTSILQVVRNPAWLTPYIACIVMTIGLFTQFGMHLWVFTTKRMKKIRTA